MAGTGTMRKHQKKKKKNDLINRSYNRCSFLGSHCRLTLLLTIVIFVCVVDEVVSFSVPSTVIKTSSSVWKDEEEKTTTLMPLSKDPLLLVSSQPLINPEECQLLLSYLEYTQQNPSCQNNFKDLFFVNTDGSVVFSLVSNEETEKTNDVEINDNGISSDSDIIMLEKVRVLLQRVRTDIDRLTNAHSHAGDLALPRYLQFSQVAPVPNVSTQGVQSTMQALFPDGLHSDNTNGMVSRHISALLYLTTNDDDDDNTLVGGATNFPLAQPLQQQPMTPWDDRIRLAAQRILVENQVHHSGKRDWSGADEECTLLESAAYSLFYKESIGPLDFFPPSTLGIRVKPKAGQLCVFHNLTPQGTPNPMAFHGGEALLSATTTNNNNQNDISGQKVLLAFFKTIPPPSNDISQNNNMDPTLYFQQKASESRQWFLSTYYDNE